MITEVKLSGLAKLGVAKRRRREADILSKLNYLSKGLRKKRATLLGPSGIEIDTWSIDSDMVKFLTNIGATKVKINWEE